VTYAANLAPRPVAGRCHLANFTMIIHYPCLQKSKLPCVLWQAWSSWQSPTPWSQLHRPTAVSRLPACTATTLASTDTNTSNAVNDLSFIKRTRCGSIYWKYRWYIADIDKSVSVSYQHFRYRFFSIYRYRIGDKWNISNFSIFCRTFSDFLTLIYRQTIT